MGPCTSERAAALQAACPADVEPSAAHEPQDSLGLKWGSLKYWDIKTPAAVAALEAYFKAGKRSLSAMAQRDNDAQKKALCDLIDAVDCPIFNDWSGEEMSKEAAKAYVLEYRR